MLDHYLGIDVGFSESRRDTTGLCLITLEQGSFKWICRNTGSTSDRRLKDLMELIPAGTNVCAVGIDGPLAEEFRSVNRYRAADALLTRGLFNGRCNPGNTNSPNGQKLHRHATKLAKLVLGLENEGYLRVENAVHPTPIHRARVVEAFPHAFLGVLLEGARCEGIGRKEKSDQFWRVAIADGLIDNLLQRLVPQIRLDQSLDTVRGRNQSITHEYRAAFICALTGLCVSKNKYVSAGHLTDGSIFLPPFDVWGADFKSDSLPWGKVALRKNLLALTTPQNVSKYPQHREAVVFSNGEKWH